jgi:hypothetical protein
MRPRAARAPDWPCFDLTANAHADRAHLHPERWRDRDVPEIERGVTAFARSGTGDLIVAGSALAVVHRDPIITLAARHKLPAIYYTGVFVPAGGLMSYGPNITDQFRDAAGYIDRILKGDRSHRTARCHHVARRLPRGFDRHCLSPHPVRSKVDF